ncbi:cation:proton antiporter [Marinithermus hydrothermalis]|uniref:Sodium/hydrogen exchanger n=1 Tax=Marinithermus hydrothermalis (strain DSM 14884 / JCM 11576 / T1) TaxID=869210 RepID=F2NNL7_MARHT|nr:sodium:proton antiporter [Marinithermus hydrothermalis]AEB11032.1 sodium/hydrogen exchanger [Marinithermus hydrothermalis DSM 14884]
MGPFEALAVLLTLTAAFAYLNERWVRLPTPVGVMLGAMLTSLGLVLLGGPTVRAWAAPLLARLEFSDLLLQGLLSFLLFAGALHVNLEDLLRRKWAILTLATLSVLTSTFLVGTLIHAALGWVGLELPYGYALLFGALISPTDPIAVLGILRKAGVPKPLEALITGESLFNDGVGIVVFRVLLGLALANGASETSLAEAGLLFLEEAGGGALLGLGIGLAAYAALRSVDRSTVEVLITLALVTGGYALAQYLHTSGPIAMVVAGLLIGNHGRLFAMSARTREHLDTFWEVTDEILNALLFVLIGLEVLILPYDPAYLAATLIAIPLVLLARLLSVGIPLGLLRLVRPLAPYTVRLMTWGGLRGGISVALALLVPPGPERDLILGMTYGVVVFSILVQGLTIGRVARYAARTP